ncbi:hypothetical protein C8F04DRAFT_1394896 [Mycena alexandri]|uniref:DUF6533 domain-containing protein n=1 Tax=Mycena alexandri TaxID=1745969 RepID=A0AAD6SWV8_9AGAR|nr:hypothetical protein C8F04DRAFT_1394896 [Mycena alexandri]
MGDNIPPEVALSWMRLQAVKAGPQRFSAHYSCRPLKLVFDYCLTFDLEASLIWPSRRSFSKTLFMLARYTPFLDVPVGLYYILAPNIALDTCFNLNVVSTSLSVFGIAIGELILVVRTYALGGRVHTVLVVLSIIYTVNFSLGLLTVFLVLFPDRGISNSGIDWTISPQHDIEVALPILPAIPGCNETGGNFILVGVCFIIVLLNETVLMSYIMWLGYKKYRHFRSPFIVTLYRDGITYFIFLFLGSTANFTILLAGEGELQELLNTFLRVMHSVLSTRVLLHVRDVERTRAEESRRLQTITGPSMVFANDDNDDA